MVAKDVAAVFPDDEPCPEATLTAMMIPTSVPSPINNLRPLRLPDGGTFRCDRRGPRGPGA